MVCLVLPFITKGLTIILEYALVVTLKLLFLLLILLYVTILTSITILMIHSLLHRDNIRRSLYLWTMINHSAMLCQAGNFGYLAILILVFSVRYDTTTQFFIYMMCQASYLRFSLVHLLCPT
mgnify:CR=1 FL=1